MWTANYSVAAALGVLAVAAASPASAADPWFQPYESTTIPNGAGPGPAPRGTASADFTGDGKPDIVTISDFTMGNILLGAARLVGRSGRSGTAGGSRSRRLDRLRFSPRRTSGVVRMRTSVTDAM